MNFWIRYYGPREKSWHLVLENYTNSAKKEKFGYYFVDLVKECLFWLDEYDATDIDDGVKIRSTSAHLGTFDFSVIVQLAAAERTKLPPVFRFLLLCARRFRSTHDLLISG